MKYNTKIIFIPSIHYALRPLTGPHSAAFYYWLDYRRISIVIARFAQSPHNYCPIANSYVLITQLYTPITFSTQPPKSHLYTNCISSSEEYVLLGGKSTYSWVGRVGTLGYQEYIPLHPQKYVLLYPKSTYSCGGGEKCGNLCKAGCMFMAYGVVLFNDRIAQPKEMNYFCINTGYA